MNDVRLVGAAPPVFLKAWCTPILAALIQLIWRRHPQTAVGWAMRRTWPDGTHEFVAWKTTKDKAVAFHRSDMAYWRRGPMRPAYDLIQISLYEFNEHRAHRFCRHSTCTIANMVMHPLDLESW